MWFLIVILLLLLLLFSPVIRVWRAVRKFQNDYNRAMDQANQNQADSQKNDEKNKQRDYILAPFTYLNCCPKFRKSHGLMRSNPKIRCKVTIFFARMQIFLYFCSRFSSKAI